MRGDSGESLLLKLVSLVADLVGIWAFLGSSADRTQRLALGGGLALLALVAGFRAMITALKVLFSKRGSFVRRDKRMRHMLDGLLVLCFAGLLVVGVVEAATTPSAHPAKASLQSTLAK